MILFDRIRAILVRLIFMAHSTACIWRLTLVSGNDYYWLLALAHLPMLFEAYVTILMQKGHEARWFSPSVLCYLTSAVPAIWFLQIEAFISSTSDSDYNFLDYKHIMAQGLSVGILVYLMVFVLVIGRWLLPQGGLSHNMLSQYLLALLGVGADMVDLLGVFEEDIDDKDKSFVTYMTMTAWTLSLIQFCFCLIGEEDDNSKVINNKVVPTGKSKKKTGGCTNGRIEIFNILLTIFLMDGAYLALRLLLLIEYQILTQSNLFFIGKNSLVLMLEFYRILTLLCAREKNQQVLKVKREEIQERARSARAASRPSDREDADDDGSDTNDEAIVDEIMREELEFEQIENSIIRRGRGENPRGKAIIRPPSDLSDAPETEYAHGSDEDIPSISIGDSDSHLYVPSPRLGPG